MPYHLSRSMSPFLLFAHVSAKVARIDGFKFKMAPGQGVPASSSVASSDRQLVYAKDPFFSRKNGGKVLLKRKRKRKVVQQNPVFEHRAVTTASTRLQQ